LAAGKEIGMILTVGDLRRALRDVPDGVPITFFSV
jgi:hypothetical protein